MSNAIRLLRALRTICRSLLLLLTSVSPCVSGRALQAISFQVPIKGFALVPSYSEAALQSRVAVQPVAVALEADDSFQFYSGGVYTGPCGTDQNHEVVIVGYSTTSMGTPYWIMKNSWGTDWGENGYARFKRNYRAAAGLCGIAIGAVYPTM